MNSPKRLYRSSDSMIAGVCAGIAEYFNIDPTFIRILAVVVVIAGLGFPIILYIIGMIIIPKDPAIKSGYINVKTESVRRGEPASSSAKEAQAQQAQPTAFSTDSQPVGAAGSMPIDGAPHADSVADIPEPAPAKKPANRSFAVVAGAFLVCVGVLILLGNLVNVSFWRFWPVVFIVIGLIQLFSPSSKGWSLERAGGAICLMTLGLILLAWSLQIVSVRAFIMSFFNLWPVLLIIGGIYIISGAKKLSALNLVGSLLFSATLIFGTWYYGAIRGDVEIRLPGGHLLTFSIPSSPGATAIAEGDFSEVAVLDLATREQADLYVHGGGVSMHLSAGEGSDIVVGSVAGFSGGVDLGFSDAPKGEVNLNLSTITGGSVTETTLPRAVLWNYVDVAAGAADLELDFTGLQVRDINLDTGVSSSTLRLDDPHRHGSALSIHAGMASVKVEVPSDCAVIVFTDGLNSTIFDQRYFTYNPKLEAWCSNTYTSVFGDRLVVDGKVWTINQNGVASLEVSVVDE